MRCRVYGEECVCPKCGDFLTMNIDVGDGYKYDICPGCGFKRKKDSTGRLVDKAGNVIEEQKDGKV